MTHERSGATRHRVALALCAALLTGCANLSAISDYATSASAVAGATEPAQRWRDSERNLLALRADGDSPRCGIGRPDRAPQAQFDAAYAQAQVVHEELAAYFDALAELASGRQPPPRPSRAPTLKDLSEMGGPIGPKDEAALRAMASLGTGLLDGRRRVALREVMQASHEDVTRLLALLERLSVVYAAEVRGESIQAGNYIRCAAASTDPAVQFLARRERLRVQARYDDDQAALQTYTKALRQLQQDHAEILAALALGPQDASRVVGNIAKTGRTLNEARRAIMALRS